MTETIEIESTGVSEENIKTLSDGRIIKIGKHDADFYEKLIKLDALAKIELMYLDLDDMEKYIKTARQNKMNELLSFFNQKWVWRMDDGAVDFSDASLCENCFSINLSAQDIIKKIKKGKLTPEQTQQIRNFFESGNEVKLLEN